MICKNLFIFGVLASGLAVTFSGCRASKATYDAEYLGVPRVALLPQPIATPESLPIPDEGLAGPHSEQEYIAIALSQNPRIQVQRKRVEAAAMRVPQAASLEDPMLEVTGWPIYPNVPQTASGRMTVDVMVTQQVPWHGKLETRALAAEAELDQARATLASTELEVREAVSLAYYQLYAVQRSIKILEQTRALSSQIRDVAGARLQAALVNQQDLLRAELDITDLDRELITMRQELAAAQAKLAQLLHVSPDTELRALDTLDDVRLPVALENLYQQAVAARPELHAQLAAVRRDQFNTDLARLAYFPDLTVGFGWGEMTTNRALAPTADGIDNLTFTVMANIPIYRQRLRAGVREAESEAVAMAREYDAMRDETLQQVKALFVEARAQQELLQLFQQDILPKAEQTLEVSLQAYQTGETDFLQLLDNRQQVLKYQLAYERLAAQLRSSIAKLERLLVVWPASVEEEIIPPVASE